MLKNLTTPELACQTREFKELMSQLAKEMIPIDNLFESISEKMKEPCHLSSSDIQAIQKQTDELVEKITLAESTKNSPCNQVKYLLQTAISATNVLGRLKTGGKSDHLQDLLFERREQALLSLVGLEPTQVRYELEHLGPHARYLHRHPIVQEILDDSSEQPFEQSLEQPLVESDREEDLTSDKQQLQIQHRKRQIMKTLISSFRLPMETAEQIASKISPEAMEKREAELSVLFGRSTPAILRNDPKALTIPDPVFERYTCVAQEVLSALSELDSKGILSRVNPDRTGSAFTPNGIQGTRTLVLSLSGARETLLLLATKLHAPKESLWREFLTGLEQAHAQNSDETPIEIANKIANSEFPKKFPEDLNGLAIRKLTAVFAATTLDQIRQLPGNKLEVFHDQRHTNATYFIRINDLWRVGFRFNSGRSTEVSLINYH